MTAFAAVLLYILWMFFLTLVYAGPRLPQGLTGKKPLDSWERDKPPTDPAFLQRAKAAHLNCVEGLPAFAGVVVIAALMSQIEVADNLAAYVLYARIAQSVVHISGISFMQITARATFFIVQLALIGYMALQLLGLIAV